MSFRVQRSRFSKPGIPSGAVYVGRPSQWGNPAIIGEYYRSSGGAAVLVENNYLAVDIFYDHCKHLASNQPEQFFAWIFPLIDKNLCCWCKPTDVCHADVLLFLSKIVKSVAGLEDRFTRISEGVKDWPPLSDFIKI